jgi:hypothetical protein
VAHKKRRETERQSALELEPVLKERVERAESEETSRAQPRDAALYLAHAGLRSECWSPMSGMPSANACGASASPLAATRPRRGAARKRSPLHRSRPLLWAEARFTSHDGEFLGDR